MADQHADIILGHDFDGIQEYDNRLPNWWLLTLYGAILFSVLYWTALHTWRWMPQSHEKYRQEMAEAAQAQLAAMATQQVSDEALLLMSQIPENVARGKAIFDGFCVACHLADGSGQVGPNLTDAFWLHGGRPLQIHHTVTYGVPEKGMVAWGNQLGPARVQDVVAYVLTLKGKNRPGKAPQGEPETQGAPPPADAAAQDAPATSGPALPAAASAPRGG
jgi:cytochrome c oxidase cbb3-type subunit 3